MDHNYESDTEANIYNLIIVLFVETPRKFITAIPVFPQTKLLYVLSPCKHTKNLIYNLVLQL